MKIRRLPVLRGDFEFKPLSENTMTLPFERQFSKEEYEKLQLGHLSQSVADNTFALFESDILYICNGNPPTCWYKVAVTPLSDGAIVSDVQIAKCDRDSENIEWLKGNLEVKIISVINFRRVSLTPDSWGNTQPMPDNCSAHEIDELFTERELCHLMWGQLPLSMDDKWFVYGENMTLYYHRSWTGVCVFQVNFEKVGINYRATSVLVNDEMTNLDFQFVLRSMRFYAGYYPYRYEIIEE